MTFAAIGLLVVSAVVHAVWNLIGKRENPSSLFFVYASMFGCMCLLPVMLTHVAVVRLIPMGVWVFLLATGVFQAVYYWGLAGAYRSGHLSIAYPLARSAPVLIVALVGLLMGKEHQLTPISILGMVLVAVGSLVLPIERLADWHPRDYLHPATLFALMAALGTSGYSIVDDSALRLLRSSVGAQSSRIALTLVYAFFENLSALCWLGLFVLCGRKSSAKSAKPALLSTALAGFGICFAYCLVLLAMTFAKNVSYVVAFRQLSIPIGAALGVTVLREPRTTSKLIGVAVMLAGLLLVALR